MPKSGKYRLINEHKYVGDPDKIFYRSSWEKNFLKFLDVNQNVKRFSSEEIVIPYISPLDGRQHRYFPDFFIEFANGRKVIIEIKPYNQAVEPAPPKRQGQVKQYERNLAAFLVNQAKWNAAKTFCMMNGFEFEVFTEQELSALGFKFL